MCCNPSTDSVDYGLNFQQVLFSIQLTLGGFICSKLAIKRNRMTSQLIELCSTMNISTMFYLLLLQLPLNFLYARERGVGRKFCILVMQGITKKSFCSVRESSWNHRSSRPQLFCKKDVLKNWQNSQKNTSDTGVSFVKFFRKTFFKEHSRCLLLKSIRFHKVHQTEINGILGDI